MIGFAVINSAALRRIGQIAPVGDLPFHRAPDAESLSLDVEPAEPDTPRTALSARHVEKVAMAVDEDEDVAAIEALLARKSVFDAYPSTSARPLSVALGRQDGLALG